MPTATMPRPVTTQAAPRPPTPTSPALSGTTVVARPDEQTRRRPSELPDVHATDPRLG